MSAKFNTLLMNTVDYIRKDLLKKEIALINNFAISGEVIERQFFLIICADKKDDTEIKLKKKCLDLIDKFKNCGISSWMIDRSEIIRLCNLFTNPAYAHLDNGIVEATMPIIV